MSFAADYKISERWQVQWLEQFDFGHDTGLTHRLHLRRKLHEWFVTMEFELDETRGETQFSLLFTPVGLSEGKARLR